MRRRLIVANWKMHKTSAEAVAYVRELCALFRPQAVDMVLAPPYTALYAAKRTMIETAATFALAGQDLFWEDQGPFTGAISAPMLKEVGCDYVIIGHSERRQWFGDDDQEINKKVHAALRHGLRPILCVGESLTDREGGKTKTVVTGQLQAALAGVTKEEIGMITIAYEPVWAIGTGRAATADQATEVHALLRATIVSLWGHDSGQSNRILYGGSVNPNNIREFLMFPEVDGVLVGGSCLDPAGFATIARFAEDSTSNERRGV